MFLGNSHAAKAPVVNVTIPFTVTQCFLLKALVDSTTRLMADCKRIAAPI